VKWRDWRLASLLTLAGLLWSVVLGFVLWFVPLGESVSSSSAGETTTGAESFASLSGYGPLPLIIPAALCVLALLAALRHHRLVLISATVVLGLFSFLAGFSIGLFYVPAVLALLVACLATQASHQAQGHGTTP
jgi:hypothetical protein